MRALGMPPRALLAVGLLTPAMWLTACGTGPDLVGEVALPAEQSVDFVDGEIDVDGPVAVELTPAQRGYLDALTAAGVQPASELRALSIGAYICQARAAGQTDQSVWDHVAPKVRSDVADSRVVAPQSAAPMQGDAVVVAYIDIATQRLC